MSVVGSGVFHVPGGRLEKTRATVPNVAVLTVADIPVLQTDAAAGHRAVELMASAESRETAARGTDLEDGGRPENQTVMPEPHRGSSPELSTTGGSLRPSPATHVSAPLRILIRAAR